MHDPRIAKLAEVLVNYSVGVKPGQLAGISGPPGAQPLMIELYRQVLRAGGYAFVRVNPEILKELLIREGNESQLRYVNPIGLYEYQTVDCWFGIWGEENTRSATRTDPGRASMVESARKPLLDVFFRRAAENQLRWCGTQFPTNACAQDAEMSLTEYEDFVFKAGKLDHPDPIGQWKIASERQQRLIDLLAGKSDYRVVAANGTDIRMNLAGKTWINCDGHENFPDGEVFTGPELASVNGRVCFSFPTVYHGREVTDVRLTFKDGKVVDASASKGQGFLYSMLDMDAGSRFLGECAIGTNYDITGYTRNTLFDEKIGGTVHFALGAGYPETGNANQSGLHWDMVVDLRQGGRIEIDGQTISADGRFLKENLPGG